MLQRADLRGIQAGFRSVPNPCPLDEPGYLDERALLARGVSPQGCSRSNRNPRTRPLRAASRPTLRGDVLAGTASDPPATDASRGPIRILSAIWRCDLWIHRTL